LQNTIDINLLLGHTRGDLAETLEALRVSEATSRAQAEQLRKVSDELSATLNTAGIGITRCSRDLHYLRANETYAIIAGLPLSRIVGRPIVEVMGEAAFSTIQPYIERVLAGERVEYETEIPLSYGAERSFYRVVYVPDRNADGSIVGWIACVADITSSKQAEARLAERNAQFELARRAARVGDYTYDISAGTMRFARSSMADFGLSDSTMEITAQQWHSRIHRDDVQRLRTEHIRAFKERRRELVSEFRIIRPGGETRWIEARGLIAYDDTGRAERLTGIYIDVTERRKAEDHKSLLIAELDHRVKNVLACVTAIAERSRESSRSAEEFIHVLNDRIKSLANTHSLLSRSRWQGVTLSELVRSELAFCGKDESVSIKGAEVTIAAEAAQPMAMVLHELATNAAKYGALSNDHGRLWVQWRLLRGPSRGKLVIEWKEIAGRRIAAPNASGYGTCVIRDLIPYELGGAVHYVFTADGIRCTLEIPARWVSGKA
jgi:PAS domain S-box-containing protein